MNVFVSNSQAIQMKVEGIPGKNSGCTCIQVWENARILQPDRPLGKGNTRELDFKDICILEIHCKAVDIESVIDRRTNRVPLGEYPCLRNPRVLAEPVPMGNLPSSPNNQQSSLP